MTIAVIGLGAMGSRMAGRLIDAGYDVVVWNRSADRTKPLVERGATPADSPADAAARAEAVITMVTGPAALDAVTQDLTGATVIQMSTVGPAAVQRLGASIPELLDAPVLGSIAEAESGSLKIFVGGPEPLVEKWTPLLSVLGQPMHVGPVGAGSAAKLVANTVLVEMIGLLGETVALGQGTGLSRETVFDVLAVTPLAQQAERRRQAFDENEYPPRFALSLARKDADLIVEAAKDAGIDLRLAPSARSWLIDAEAAGLGSLDYSAVLARITGDLETA